MIVLRTKEYSKGRILKSIAKATDRASFIISKNAKKASAQLDKAGAQVFCKGPLKDRAINEAEKNIKEASSIRKFIKAKKSRDKAVRNIVDEIDKTPGKVTNKVIGYAIENPAQMAGHVGSGAITAVAPWTAAVPVGPAKVGMIADHYTKEAFPRYASTLKRGSDTYKRSRLATGVEGFVDAASRTAKLMAGL